MATPDTLNRRVKAFLLCGDEARDVDYYRAFLDCLPKDALIFGIREDYYRSDAIRIFVGSSCFPENEPGTIPPSVHEGRIGWWEEDGHHERFEWRWCE